MILNNGDDKNDKKNNFFFKNADGNRYNLSKAMETLAAEAPVEEEGAGLAPVSSSTENETFSSVMNRTYKPVEAPGIDGLFSTHVSPGDEPVRDAAQAQRINKMAKFNLIAKGLETVFGAAVGAQGEVVPGPFDNSMTQQISTAIMNMDNRYFQDLARFRDRQFRADLINMDQDNKADQARLSQMRWEVEELRKEGRYQDALAKEEEQQAFENEMAKGRLALDKDKLRDQRNRTRIMAGKGGSGERDYGSVPFEHRGMYDQFIKQKISQLEAQKESAIETDVIDEEISQLKELSYNFSPKTGLPERTYREALGWAQGMEDLRNRENQIRTNIANGSYSNNLQQAERDIMETYMASGVDEATAREYTQNYMRQNGMIAKDERVSAPNPRDYDNPLDYAVDQMEYDKGSRTRAEKDAVNEKRGILEAELHDAILQIGDADVGRDIRDNYKVQPENAVKNAIKSLNKEKQKALRKLEEIGFFGTTDKETARKPLELEAMISRLENKLEDYKRHEDKYGKK